MGVGVLGVTAYRLLVLQQPETQRMGALGLIALAVNVAAAIVLIPHRHGDANVRAVWLFRRNDAIGEHRRSCCDFSRRAVAVVIACLFFAISILHHQGRAQ